MKKYVLVLFILFSLTSWSHSDKDYIYQYDNITVRFTTGFLFEEIENAKIIGQYASILCKNRGYDSPILLDFIHDYGHFYEGKTHKQISFDSGGYNWISFYQTKYDTIIDQEVLYAVPLADTLNHAENLIKENTLIKPVEVGNKIVIRQLGFNFKIDETLKLLEYAINHPNEIKETSANVNLNSYLDNSYYTFKSIPAKKIEAIIKGTFSELKKILKNKVYRQEDSISRYQVYHSYFSKNNKYHQFEGHNERETVIDTVSHIYSLKNFDDVIDESFFVFIKPNAFKYYKKDLLEEFSQKSDVKIIPLEKFEFITFVDLNLFKEDIFEIDYYGSFWFEPSKRFYYLSNDDILVNDFESYINSHRKNTD